MSERPPPAALDDIDRAIINALQGDFPLCPAPYAAAAEKLGLDEATLLARLNHLLECGALTRFGPLFQIERMGGAFCLAALTAPEELFEEVAGLVNTFPEVAHNYRRDHELNMWFVLATEHPAGIAATARAIEEKTGLPVLLFPKQREYFVEMKLRA